MEEASLFASAFWTQNSVKRTHMRTHKQSGELNDKKGGEAILVQR